MSIDSIVIRRTLYRDSDLIVELFTPEHGRVSAIARGARKSQRRFAGGLEVGTRLHVEMTRRGKGLASINGCTVVSPLKAVRHDLERFHQLSYVLELVRSLSAEGQADPVAFSMLVHFMDNLDAHEASLARLATWELQMLAHHGQYLQFWPCVRTGGEPDVVSLSQGGAVARASVGAIDGIPVAKDVLFGLQQIVTGELVSTPLLGSPMVRHLFDELWPQIIGKRLKSSRFLLPGDPLRLLNDYHPNGRGAQAQRGNG